MYLEIFQTCTGPRNRAFHAEMCCRKIGPRKHNSRVHWEIHPPEARCEAKRFRAEEILLQTLRNRVTDQHFARLCCFFKRQIWHFSGCVFYNNILLILNCILGILRKSRDTAKEESIFRGDFYNAPSAYPNTYMYILSSNMTALASYLCFTRALLLLLLLSWKPI